ncbi:flagellar protein FlaG [Methylobacterium sp. NEAU K]|uniref:flagellar protein FlaG n=1 Tax=Methylobacterium sp. NEAU K TaxID=3064946 RepID=UPI002733A511|nr:flagellar protein FlaG [Methylobacterium sp. NEAU K]MDP4002481.1 flagellar protein FlaG [Methylobacterium sp. NEAU K]
MDIRPLNAATPGPQGLDALAASAASAATQDAPVSQTATTPLEPAVKLDIGSGGSSSEGKARYIQDPDTSAIVFQVVDPSSGSVIEQLPSETALRNRAYDAVRGTQGGQSGGVSRFA